MTKFQTSETHFYFIQYCEIILYRGGGDGGQCSWIVIILLSVWMAWLTSL